jgi:cell division septum initiation protein DivIVA
MSGREDDNTPIDGTDEVAEDQQFDGDYEEEAPSLTLDDLLGLTGEDYEEFGEEANHKGLKPLHEWMPHIPEEVRKHIANIRSDYTRKMQEISSQRKELENLRNELLSTKESTLNNPLLQSLGQVDEEAQHDLYSEEGIQAEIKRQASIMLKDMLKPAQEKIQQERRQMELNQFKAEHPELTDDNYRLPIARMLIERPELKLEDAYFIVKAKVDSERVAQEKQELAQRTNNRKEVFEKTSTGRNSAPKVPPKTRDAWEIYQWHKNNPDYKRK